MHNHILTNINSTSGITAICHFFLYDYYDKLPTSKQTILVYSTKLSIIGLSLPLFRTAAMTLFFYIFEDSVISEWIDKEPAVACSITDAGNWNILMYVSMTQIIALKILLVVSPTTFIAINEPRTKQICLINVLLCIIYVLGQLLANGKTCNGKSFLITFKYIFELKGYDLNEKEITTWKQSFPVISFVLFLSFMIELGLQLFVIIKKRVRKIKRQTLFRMNKISPASNSVSNTSHAPSRPIEEEPKFENSGEGPSHPDVERQLENQNEADQKNKTSIGRTAATASLVPSQTSYNCTLVQERL